MVWAQSQPFHIAWTDSGLLASNTLPTRLLCLLWFLVNTSGAALQCAPSALFAFLSCSSKWNHMTQTLTSPPDTWWDSLLSCSWDSFKRVQTSICFMLVPSHFHNRCWKVEGRAQSSLLNRRGMGKELKHYTQDDLHCLVPNSFPGFVLDCFKQPPPTQMARRLTQSQFEQGAATRPSGHPKWHALLSSSDVTSGSVVIKILFDQWHISQDEPLKEKISYTTAYFPR